MAFLGNDGGGSVRSRMGRRRCVSGSAFGFDLAGLRLGCRHGRWCCRLDDEFADLVRSRGHSGSCQHDVFLGYFVGCRVAGVQSTPQILFIVV